MFSSSGNITFDFFSFPNKPNQAVDECRYFCLMILASWGLPLLGYAGEAVDENTTPAQVPNADGYSARLLPFLSRL
jgi:hypothetical protein